MLNLLAAASFAAFVLAGVGLLGRRRDAADRRRRTSPFLACALLCSTLPGLAQRDAWPFSSWPLAASAPGRSVTYATVVAVDGEGREHAVDARAWQPLAFDELLSWIQLEFPKLGRAEQDAAAAYVLAQAETARATALATGRVGRAPLGPLTAPDFLLHPRLWTDGATPRAAFVRLRVYSETLVLDAPARGGGAVRRTLDYEYP